MNDLASLVQRCQAGGVVMLSGAGISTDSGIPDYRGTGRAPRTPIEHHQFVRDPDVRRRYWSRSLLGYRTIAEAEPNRGHLATARLERDGRLNSLITQNVDGLHQAAGAENVVELHGSLHRVACLGCAAVSTRADLQRRLTDANPWLAGQGAEVLPDGDAAVELSSALVVPDCVACGGALMPDVVMFGGNVAAPVVAGCRQMVERARLLLVVGSSLTVFSGYRFAVHARDHGVPIAIVNRGPTRADPLATWRVDDSASDVLTALAAG